jgi:hypothetical protein
MDLQVSELNNDLVFENGELQVVDGNPGKAQRIRSRLLSVKGEWFLDPNFGVDYHNLVWVKLTPHPIIAAHIQQQALLSADPGDVISEFDMVLDSATRTLRISISVEASNGTITTVTV